MSPTSAPHHSCTTPETIYFSRVQPSESKILFPTVTAIQCFSSNVFIFKSLSYSWVTILCAVFWMFRIWNNG